MVDLKKLEKMLDESLEKETKESLNEWLDNQRSLENNWGRQDLTIMSDE